MSEIKPENWLSDLPLSFHTFSVWYGQSWASEKLTSFWPGKEFQNFLVPSLA